jgi:hypothetical protein
MQEGGREHFKKHPENRKLRTGDGKDARLSDRSMDRPALGGSCSRPKDRTRTSTRSARTTVSTRAAQRRHLYMTARGTKSIAALVSCPSFLLASLRRCRREGIVDLARTRNAQQLSAHLLPHHLHAAHCLLQDQQMPDEKERSVDLLPLLHLSSSSSSSSSLGGERLGNGDEGDLAERERFGGEVVEDRGLPKRPEVRELRQRITMASGSGKGWCMRKKEEEGRKQRGSRR